MMVLNDAITRPNHCFSLDLQKAFTCKPYLVELDEGLMLLYVQGMVINFNSAG